MALSNKFGHILLNTSNKSEAAVGYGTLYGDMNGGISVLGDVYKTQVFGLARHINRNKEIIPVNTITKPPSAELRREQFNTRAYSFPGTQPEPMIKGRPDYTPDTQAISQRHLQEPPEQHRRVDGPQKL